ncbi:sulfatase-like hydrolase/transferase, partial [Candidatus Dependentiae bacterium]|nr:sulfatase-like hydrolase/transferase [Candidatus Dependentiae bacterium]
KFSHFSYFIQPILFAILPIFKLFSNNFEETAPIEIIILIIGTIILTISLFYIFNQVFNNYSKTSIYISFLYLMTIYGDIFVPRGTYNDSIKILSGLKYLNAYFFYPIWYLLIIIFFIYLFKIKKINNLFSNFMILPSILLLIFFTYKIISKKIKINSLIKKYDNYNNKFINRHINQLNKIKNSPYIKKPDIYYIILDAHASSEVLKKFFNYNLNLFTKKLKEMGFLIKNDSYSNYDNTSLSIPSSLNMNFYNINNHSLSSYRFYKNNCSIFLKKIGYKIINISPYHFKFNWKLKNIFNTDTYFDFTNNFFIKTLLQNFSKLIFVKSRRKCILNQIKKLKNSIRINGPKFIFSHFMCPHDPFVFDKKGDLRMFIQREPYFRNAYLEQLTFIDNQILIIIKQILKESKNPPIIILQSDHGCRMFDFSEKEINKLNKKEKKDIMFGILNCLYLPYIKKNNFNFNVSPVNNFRILFNSYFGTKFKILPNKCIKNTIKI